MKRINFSPGDKVGECFYVREAPSHGAVRRLVVKCRCGNEFEGTLSNLNSGGIRSCGCLKTEVIIKRCTRHGEAKRGGTQLYRFWQSMKDRTTNPKSTAWRHYGAKGVKMFAGWVNDFDAFKMWFVETFSRHDIPPGMTMDRVDSSGNYEPGNLRIADHVTQANNRAFVRHVPWRGRIATIRELADLAGVKQKTMFARIFSYGMTPEQAVEYSQK